jgi:hypothetical protein
MICTIEECELVAAMYALFNFAARSAEHERIHPLPDEAHP